MDSYQTNMEQQQPYGNQEAYGDADLGQHAPSLPKGARPFVDSQAQGEVDPSAYPAPKEATNKIRGRSDVLDMFCTGVNQDLLIAKTFYFFFFSAFGSLFPLMAVYFKQLAMNPFQTGILIGCRPFVEFCAAPFWGSIADKFQKGKMMLLCSVVAWILFTCSLGFIQPPATSCVLFNKTHYILVDPKSQTIRTKREALTSDDKDTADGDVKFVYDEQLSPPAMARAMPVLPHLYHKRDIIENELEFEHNHRAKRDTPLPPSHVIGRSPHVVHYTVNFKDYKEPEELVSPPFSSIVYRDADVKKAFFLLLMLVMLGEFFSCPAITLADSAVLTYLADESDHYGRQRMFGSVGWGLAMFFIGIALDHSTAFPGHLCGPHEGERNYTICFAVFSVLMGCAFLTATQFKFDYSEPPPSNVIEDPKEFMDPGPRPWNEPKIPLQEQKTGRQQFEEAFGSIKTKIYAQTMKEMPQWMVVLREFKSLRCGTFLFVAWWMGIGIGLIFAFLFWHLQDYGGTPTVFGIASIINHISEIFAFFFSFRLIAQIGHVKVLCLGLLGNVLRFLYVSLISNPWWVLPFEFIQGMTHAAVWAASCSYIAHNTPAHLRASSQGVLQGIHHGFGRGCGAIIGGIFINFWGTTVIFRAYGLLSLVVLGIFVFINFYRKDVGFQPDLPPEEDPRQMAEEGTALAPHGVPANPMPRALSSQKLNDTGDQGSYGTYNSANGMLDIPGQGTNPFAQGTDQGGSSGGGYNYQGTQYSLSPVINNENDYLNLSETNPFKKYLVKDSAITPEHSPDYEGIKSRFKAYNFFLQEASDLKTELRVMKKSPDIEINSFPQINNLAN